MKINILYLLGLVLMFSACQELDLVPEAKLSDGSLWKNSTDYERGVNILYRSFGQRGDADSDIAFTSTNATSNGTRLAPVTSNYYNNTYGNIRKCNFLIDRAVINEMEDNRFVAEARFFRAFHYSNLVFAYGDILFYTKTLDPSSEELFAARTPRKEVIDFLLADLKRAADILPLESEIPNPQRGRISKGTAMSLRARIALFEATWAKYHATGNDVNGLLDIAIESAKQVMDSEEYELFMSADKPMESYRLFFTNQGNDSKEQIFARRYDFERLRSNGQVMSAPITKKMADMYVCTDGLSIESSPLFEGRATMISEYQNRDYRMWNTTITPGAFTISRLDQDGAGIDFPNVSEGGDAVTYYRPWKFLSDEYIYGNGGVVQFIHEIRYAEVLLTYAEAIYEKNNTITDAQLNETINLTRARGGVAPLTNAFVTANSLSMQAEIRRERTVELVHEGWRRNDLRRWKTAEIEMPNAMLGVQFGGTEFETAILIDNDSNPILDTEGNTQLMYKVVPVQDANGFIIVEPAAARSFDPTRDYLEPLPTKETILNENLKQNPKW